MKNRFFLFLLPILLSLPSARGNEQILFNGENLEGWSGDSRLWRVENGILIGETDSENRQISKNTFLIWENGEPENFELSLKIRVTGDNNSGVQYRSKTVENENFLLHGYQMDAHPNQEYNAMLYEEGGRGILALRGESVIISENGERKTERIVEQIPKVDLAKWNDYRVVAQGDTALHYLNGELAAKITDRESGKFSRKGKIGLQLHAGPPMKLEAKEIRLKNLPKSENAEKPIEEAAISPKPAPEWIWSRKEAKTGEKIFLRHKIETRKKVAGATILASGDDKFELSINDSFIGKSESWQTPSRFDATEAFSGKNEHLIFIQAENEAGPAAFVFQLELQFSDGEKRTVFSDKKWEWSKTGKSNSRWNPVTSLGKMGSEPWGDIFADALESIDQTAADVTKNFEILPGFRLERIYQVPKSEGSWVALTIDDHGRLIASDQFGGLFRISSPPLEEPKTPTFVEALSIPIEGAQGLLWTNEALFASTSVGDMGVYKITDSKGDGNYDRIEQIQPLSGEGEHGPHGLTLSPDGKWIYVTAGNHTAPPRFDKSMVPEVWDEDQLLPRRPDARGHARNVMAPGGWIARFTPDGKHWELVSIGFRNTYGLAFNEHGELFTWDSDMEWDFGAPWYRPTRINHVTSGSEFGWRHGTGKWPDYYEDSLPGILDIGPGSPTGIVAGTGLAFPERFQRAIFMLDWTYATIYAVHLTPAGSSWNAEIEEILSGKGLPLTDAVVGKDGALYFTVGGRRTKSALYRLSYLGNEPTAPVAKPEPLDSKTEQLTTLRHKLEALHLDPDPDSIDLIWNALENEDRFLRFAARTALEHLPANIWQDRLQLENSNWQTIQAAIAAARTGSANDQSDVRKSLEQLDWEKLDESQKLNLLRAFGLSFIRHGKPNENLRKKLIDKFEPVFPAETDSLNRELVRMLVYLRSPQVLAQTLRLMETEPESKAPAWSNLAARNDEYGSILIAMMENMPSEQNFFYAYALRTLEGPWNIDQRYQFFSWLSEAAKKSGGSSYRGFIADLRAETLKRATPEEREMIEKWDLESKANPFENLPKVEGPGRNWSVEEALASTEKGLLNRNLANGKNMFKATLCAACHRFNGEGGEIGPDLTTIGRRFTIADLIGKIIDPNRQISDQYAFELITLKDGSASTGKILEESAENLVLSTNPFDLSETRKIARSEVEKIETSPVSPMPPGLINRLNEEELRDLLAFLLQQR